MTKLNCKPGDLAVVVTAHNPENIGTILRVIKAHRDQNALVDFKGQHIWLAEAPRPMTYNVGASWSSAKGERCPMPFCGQFVDCLGLMKCALLRL